MRFIDTLEKLRLYLSAKEKLDIKEKALLGQIREDLNYFPTGTIHRDSLLEYGYDAHLAGDDVLATLAKKMGEDSWEQLSSVQIPIIGDACKVSISTCPLCAGCGAFENGNWICEESECRREWSCMKYVWIKYSEETAFLFGCDIGFISNTSRSSNASLFLPVDLFRMHFAKSPDKENIYQIFKIEDTDDISQLKEQGYTVEKVTDTKGLERFGPKAYWMSVFPK
ncbi:hypothetical protein [Dysgonomonas termitidis]|uniref:Uncharacterized protein n=1 Tax=Dysgonomonas termitidis TaxID=1516126 RepID=A0ABV9KS94_9BACT